MKEVVKININGNTVKIYEQCLNDDYCYTAYLIGSKKKYYLGDFDSLAEAFSFSVQYCYDN